jgi:hypothetical protein
MPGPLVVPIALGIGQILGNLFGNLFGASKQAKAAKDATQAQADASLEAARLQKQSIDEALAYQKEIDARDYRDWLTREARDRTDWEASEQRRAPYRALGDSAVRTLADYIRVPGMQPAQEVPVQRWVDPNVPPPQPVSTTMPVGGTMRSYIEPVADPSLLAKFGRTPRTLADYAR